MGTVQLPVPVQTDQPVNVYPAAGAAVSTIFVPVVTVRVQPIPQAISVPVTVPIPTFATVSVNA